jgi:para-aminobenzoate synthetase/4-amino-4-deoxychorismate lyase
MAWLRHLYGAEGFCSQGFDVFLATVRNDLLELYRDLALALAQGGAYSAYLETGRFVVARASLELFFEWSDDRITTRAMKGSTTRGRFPAEDAVEAAWLAESAENVMIVDLLRSGLGKIATRGASRRPGCASSRRVVAASPAVVVAGPRMRNRDGHLARLERSASCLGFPYDPERVRRATTVSTTSCS